MTAQTTPPVERAPPTNCTIASGMTFTPKVTEQLRQAYGTAVADKQPDFVFEGQLFYTKYAMYLLQYLDSVFRQEVT